VDEVLMNMVHIFSNSTLHNELVKQVYSDMCPY
jgi:hypothetical protein